MNIQNQEKNTLVKLIEERMRALGWKPADLVAESRVAQPVISRLLRGSKNIGVDNIFRILDALGVIAEENIYKALVEKAHKDFLLSEGQKSFNGKSQGAEEKLLKEQVEFYKEKAVFYEKRNEELKREILSGKRKGDPEDLDVKKLRKSL